MTVPPRKVVEAILLVADAPVTSGVVSEILELPRRAVQELLEELAGAYQREDRGFVLREVAGGWRLYTSPDCAPWLERFVTRRAPPRLSGAALEVLAVVAYRGPVSRARISEIRGVESDRVVKTLLDRGLLSEAGRDEGPGAPILLRLSDELVEQLGLRSLDELPPLTDFMPDTEAVEVMERKLSPGGA